MRLRIVILLATSCVFLYLFNSCKHKPFPPPADTSGNFPAPVAAIFTTRCAVTGCHDEAGSVNAGKLRLDTWENLFKGSSHGAVIIPFNPDYSSLLYFINADSTQGIVAKPTMPYNLTPLSSTEYNTIKNWIIAGAPDKNGNIPFASDPLSRQKIYVAEQGCDLMAVLDGSSGLTMRLFHIGGDINQTESPHNVRTSADGMYAYVGFAAGSVVQKIDTHTDTVVSTLSLGAGLGGVVNISPDGQKVLVADLLGNQIYKVDFSTMAVTPVGAGAFISPHGIASTPNWDTFFVTAQKGNVVYRYVPGKTPPVIKIPLDTNQPTSVGTAGLYGDPHEILMTPDNSKLFVTCQFTNEVRVLDAHTYKVLAAFPVGKWPQELAVSPSKHLVFATCMEDDANTKPGCKGSVYVFDYNTLQQVGGPIYGDFYEPHGITVDERSGRFYVVSANINLPVPPHHVTKCAGTPGWYSIYDLNSLQPLTNYRYESTVAPYSADVRFK